MDYIKTCPICSTELEDFKNKICDFAVTKETFNLSRCSSCKTLYTNPRPKANEIDKYYQSKQYISHNTTSFSIKNIIYKIVRQYMFHYKLKHIKPYLKGNKILDYGCGNGHFIKFLKKQNYTVTGYEPNQAATKQSSLPIYNKFENITPRFDAITLWHVLEHIKDPVSCIKTLKNHLCTDGLLIIAVPNYLSYDGQYYEQNWAGLDVPRHLTHFNKKSLIKLLYNNDFSFITSFPLIFDAYFVSIMSELYKKSNAYPLSGLWRGYLSNKKAKKTKEYSSYTFIFKLKND